MTNLDPLVVFLPSGKRGRFSKGTPVIEAARDLGVYVESVCGGRGICGRCQIEVETGQFAKHGISSQPDHISPFGANEAAYAERKPLRDGRRLSCHATIQGDLVINIPADVQVNTTLVRKDADNRIIERKPAVSLCYIEVEEPDMHKPLGDLDRLLLALKDQWGFENAEVPPRLLPKVQSILRKGQWKATAALYQQNETDRPRLIALKSGFHNEAYGLACDIGSTTIAMHLSSLLSGVTLASAGLPNPQIKFGEDLMSRVSYVMMNPNGVEAMTQSVRAAVNSLIDQLIEQSGVARDDILDSVFVGNPIMHHLFLGIDPTELGGAPFALAVSSAVTMEAADNGITLAEGAMMHCLPCIAGHVGADAAAATLSEGPHRQDDMMLLVDVGTNAEIVLGNKQRCVAASSPTGPAFEGAEISSGQRAAIGAIERVRIDPLTLEPRFKVIGADPWSDEEGFAKATKKTGITGICGSGIIEIIGEMFLAGIINEDGVVDAAKAAISSRIEANGRTFSYVLYEGAQRITVTQNDVRAIQLAKAALYAGVKLLMEKQGIEQVDAIRLAGGFGSFIDPKYALVLGLIPDCALENVKAVGNAAGAGARMALLNTDHRSEISEAVQRIEKIETALEPAFQQHFVSAMALPNKTDAFPRLGSVVALPERLQNSTTDEGSQRRRSRRDHAERRNRTPATR